MIKWVNFLFAYKGFFMTDVSSKIQPKDLSHLALINLARTFAPALPFKGVCDAFILMWVRALLTSKEDEAFFYQRLDRISKYTEEKSLENLKTEIDDIYTTQTKNLLKTNFTEEELQTVELRAFAEAIAIHTYELSFINHNIYYDDLPNLLALTASKKNEEQRAQHNIEHIGVLISNRIELEHYFEALKTELMKLNQDEIIAFRLTSHNHAVGLYFDSYSGKFHFLDSNQMLGKNTYYFEADPKELPDLIFNSFPTENKEEYSPFSITAFSRTPHTELIQQLKMMTQNILLSEGRYNRINSINTTALLFACRHGNIELVEFLLDNQPIENLNPSKNNDDNLVYNANLTGHTEIVKLLSEHPIYGPALFSKACQDGNMRIINIMLPYVAKININRPDKNGNTPLSLACQEGHLEVVKLLLSYIKILGINAHEGIDVLDKSGNTPLSLACQNGHTEIVKLLLEKGANASSLPTPAILCQKGDTQTINLLIQRGANQFEFLYTACQEGNVFTVEVLLNNMQPKNIDAPDKQGNTPLLIAYQYGHIDVIKLLIKRGANTSALFSLACQENNLEVIELLLSYSPNKPALFSLACQVGNITSIQFLLKHITQENIYTPDINGNIPLLVANQYGHADLVKFLIQSCTNQADDGKTLLNIACRDGHTKIVQFLLQHNKMQNLKAPFFIACEYGKTEIVLLLLNSMKMQEINATDINGNTPLLVACKNGRLEIVQILLEHGAKKNIHRQNKFYETPLYAACCQGNFEIVKILLQHGANKYIHMPNSDGYSPFLIAEKNGHTKIVALLKKEMLPGAEETVKLFTKKEKNQSFVFQQNNLHIPLYDKKRKAGYNLAEEPPVKKQNTTERAPSYDRCNHS